MKFEIFKFESVKSTNDEAIKIIKSDNKEFGFVYSKLQSKGRGTHGKKWISDKGNLFGSIFFPLKKNFPPFNEFLVINSVIISDVIKHFCRNVSVNLKYPNDIFVNKKKICGILQEIITSNNKSFLITGIGINVISNPKIIEKYETTCISLHSEKKLKIEQIIDFIIASYEKFFTNLSSYNYMKIKKKADLMSLNH